MARSILVEKLDVHFNGADSKKMKEIERIRKRKMKKLSRYSKQVDLLKQQVILENNVDSLSNTRPDTTANEVNVAKKDQSASKTAQIGEISKT